MTLSQMDLYPPLEMEGSSMYLQLLFASKTLSTVTALVFTAVNIHMKPQVSFTDESLITLST